jgi:hypothetical protein
LVRIAGATMSESAARGLATASGIVPWIGCIIMSQVD